MKKHCPQISITTDIIVGFPGETDADFEATMQLLEQVRYHGAYSFKYSDRPHTVSAGFEEKVPEEVKSSRLARLQKRQQEITNERHEEYVGKIVEIMIEGESRSGEGQWSGRTTTNHIVNFTGNTDLVPGQLVSVKIEETCLHSLRGNMI